MRGLETGGLDLPGELVVSKRGFETGPVSPDAVPRQPLELGPAVPVVPRTASRPATAPPQRKTILGELGNEFPRLKQVEDLIDRFSPREATPQPTVPAKLNPLDRSRREVELEDEVQLLRNRLRGQDQQIQDLTEKLNLIEKLLKEKK